MRKTGVVVIGGDYQGLGVIRSLGRQGIPVYLLDSEACIGMASKFTTKFFHCPSPEDENLLLEFLLSLAEEEKLNKWVVYPTDDETVKVLSINKRLLEKYYKIPTPDWAVSQILYNKKLTYKLAEKIDIDIPRTVYPKDINEVSQIDLAFPVIVKPVSQGRFYQKTKKKALKARDKTELIKIYKKTEALLDSSEIMIQEVITGGPENLFSFCSLFKEGIPLAKLVAKRSRQHPMDFGRASTFVETVDIPELEELGTKFLNAINYYGLSEVEFMWDPRDKRYKLLEINARTWGWHTMGNIAGVDFPLLLFKDLMGEEVRSNSFCKGVKWIRILTDTPLAFKEILKGKLRINDYLLSLKGEKEYAVWSLRDLLPFVMEFLLLPYLWKKRGF